MPKLSGDLQKKLAATPMGDSVDVVVEVGGKSSSPTAKTGDRALRIAALKKGFSTCAEPIERAIESSGGTVLDRAWLNQSLKARVPKEAVEALGEREDVERLDTPRALRPD
ncbi:MAG TPA: hypothetical protein VF173_26185 [Thermoanaerobaculia bacterium]|nr:hypothetical protein [Thermoanaerobaculia bacterium]